jgi:hypothetical protein
VKKPPAIPPPQAPTPIVAPTQPQTDDVVVEQQVTSVTVDTSGDLDAAADGAQPLQTESVKNALTGGATQMGNSLEGGPVGLPKDPKTFSLGFWILAQAVSLVVATALS